MSPGAYLYQIIADHFREQILTGHIRPGEHLPPVRRAAAEWACTSATVRRAYQQLVELGLVGQGMTAVPAGPSANEGLRQAVLKRRADSFVTETLAAGFSSRELEEALDQALGPYRTGSEP